MTQLALPLDPPASRCPSFLAESNATLLAIAGQERRRPSGRLLSLWFRGGIWTSMSGHPMSAGDPDVIEALRS